MCSLITPETNPGRCTGTSWKLFSSYTVLLTSYALAVGVWSVKRIATVTLVHLAKI